MSRYIIFFLGITGFQFADAGPSEISANQLWADQQCGGSAAYKKDEKKFNACVEGKLKLKESSTSTSISPDQLWADQECGGNAAYKKDEKKFNACVETKIKSKGPSENLKDCKKLILESDPSKDPKDADMLCNDPYLKGKPNESYEYQVRRKRLIKETEEAKHKGLDKYVVPGAGKLPSGNGSR